MQPHAHTRGAQSGERSARQRASATERPVRRCSGSALAAGARARIASTPWARGQTLARIAARYDVPVGASLAAANGLTRSVAAATQDRC